MPDVLDVFAADSAFTMAGLTKTINSFDHVPNQLSRYNLFEEEGIAETVAWIEEDKQTLTLVKVAERGAPGDTFSTDKRKMRPFKIPHMPLQSRCRPTRFRTFAPTPSIKRPRRFSPALRAWSIASSRRPVNDTRRPSNITSSAPSRDRSRRRWIDGHL